MAAYPADTTVADSGPGGAALETVTRMEAAAANGEWARTEKLAASLRAAIAEVPDAQRNRTTQAVLRVLERVQTIALTSRVDALEKLSEIRRGRIAQQAYTQSTGPQETPLR